MGYPMYFLSVHMRLWVSLYIQMYTLYQENKSDNIRTFHGIPGESLSLSLYTIPQKIQCSVQSCKIHAVHDGRVGCITTGVHNGCAMFFYSMVLNHVVGKCIYK